MQPSLAPTQTRMSSSRPSTVFRGSSGSAMRARVIPTRSHTPAARAASACSTVDTRPATITGTFTADRVSAASSLKRPWGW